MIYKAWREETFHDAGRAGIPTDTTRKLLREATTQQRISETLCSINVGEKETARLEARLESSANRVKAIAAEINWTASFNGDPRGCPFSLEQEGKVVYFPGQGLPARCFR